MKKIVLYALILSGLLLACNGKKEMEIDPRSVEYNNRAVDMMQRFLMEGQPDTTGFVQAKTLADSSRVLFRDIVDSCQALLDSAVMYSPEHHFYYTQKAMFYAYCADYEKSYQWVQKSLEKKDIPETRLYAGMILYKMGKDVPAKGEYERVIRQYRERDSLSTADVYNYAFALSLAGEKEEAARVVEEQVRDTSMKKQMAEMIAGGTEVVDALIP